MAGGGRLEFFFVVLFCKHLDKKDKPKRSRMFSFSYATHVQPPCPPFSQQFLLFSPHHLRLFMITISTSLLTRLYAGFLSNPSSSSCSRSIQLA